MQSQVYLWEREMRHSQKQGQATEAGREQGGSKPSAGDSKEELGDFPWNSE